MTRGVVWHNSAHLHACNQSVWTPLPVQQFQPPPACCCICTDWSSGCPAWGHHCMGQNSPPTHTHTHTQGSCRAAACVHVDADDEMKTPGRLRLLLCGAFRDSRWNQPWGRSCRHGADMTAFYFISHYTAFDSLLYSHSGGKQISLKRSLVKISDCKKVIITPLPVRRCFLPPRVMEQKRWRKLNVSKTTWSYWICVLPYRLMTVLLTVQRTVYNVSFKKFPKFLQYTHQKNLKLVLAYWQHPLCAVTDSILIQFWLQIWAKVRWRAGSEEHSQTRLPLWSVFF